MKEKKIVEQERKHVTVPCPDPKCKEKYQVKVTGVDLSTTVEETCDGCEKKIWVGDNSISLGKSFNIHSGDGGENNYADRWKKKKGDEWKRLS